ncbi:hypothetical protein RYX36_030595 [Vicia faba]
MASLILLISDLLWIHERDATALLAAYPPSSLSSSSSAAALAQRKSLKDQETVIDNTHLEFESREMKLCQSLC